MPQEQSGMVCSHSGGGIPSKSGEKHPELEVTPFAVTFYRILTGSRALSKAVLMIVIAIDTFFLPTISIAKIAIKVNNFFNVNRNFREITIT